MAAGFGGGFRNNRVNTCLICETVMAGVFPPHSPSFQAQEPQRQESQGHVVMPTDPTADLIMIEPGLAVTGLEHLFDAMPLTPGTDHLGHRDIGAGVAHGIVDPRLADGTEHDQAFLRTDATILLGLDPGRQDVDLQRPLLGRAEVSRDPNRYEVSEPELLRG